MPFALPKNFFEPPTSHHAKQVFHGTSAIWPAVRVLWLRSLWFIPLDLEKAFEQSVRENYPKTTKVGWDEFDTVTILKEQDSISWCRALADYEPAE